jgi:hypothetical protein
VIFIFAICYSGFGAAWGIDARTGDDDDGEDNSCAYTWILLQIAEMTVQSTITDIVKINVMWFILIMLL